MWNNKHFLKSELTSSTSFTTFVCFRFVSSPMVVRLFEDLVPQRRNLTMQSRLFVILTFPDPSGCHVESRNGMYRSSKTLCVICVVSVSLSTPLPRGNPCSDWFLAVSSKLHIFSQEHNLCWSKCFRRVWKPFAATLDKGFVVQQIALG